MTVSVVHGYKEQRLFALLPLLPRWWLEHSLAKLFSKLKLVTD